MRELQITVNRKAVKERYNKLKRLANESNTTIVPVLKNNCNGLGFDTMYFMFSEMKCPRIATSYAAEWLKDIRIRNDETVEKYSWIWSPKDDFSEVKNLTLVCKTFEQLEYCIKNGNKYYLEFVLDHSGMYRGGFTSEDIPKLLELGIKNINFQSHSPHEDKEGLEKYYQAIDEMITKLNESGISVNEVSVENSYAFMNASKRYQNGFARLGETLLLPKEDYNPIIWSTYVSAITKVPSGAMVGYNMVKVERPTTIAVLPIGYYSIEVEEIKKVKVKSTGELCDVLCAMHDTMIVDITDLKEIKVGDEIIVNDNELQKVNWNRCIQKTWKVNPDMISYKYLDL